MKGIILAGGTGSRLAPLTHFMNKHLLPVGHYPMFIHPFMQLVHAGIKDILIITGKRHIGGIADWLGSGVTCGVQLTYKIQDDAGGIAQALGLARSFVKNDLCTVILGDNIFTNDLTPLIQAFEKIEQGAQIVLKEVRDPSRYGVAYLNDGRIDRIIEKPLVSKSRFAVTGVYMYDSQVFDIIESIVPSHRGEYEITDVNNAYIQKNQLHYKIVEGDWIDAGTFESLHLASHMMIDHLYTQFDSTRKT